MVYRALEVHLKKDEILKNLELSLFIQLEKVFQRPVYALQLNEMLFAGQGMESYSQFGRL